MFVCYLWETEIQNSEFGFYWKTEHFLQKLGLVFFSLLLCFSGQRKDKHCFCIFFLALQLVSSLFKNGNF